jgi:putative membrane protein
MGLYRPKNAVGRYYSVLFSLPHWKVLASAIIAILFLAVAFLRYESVPFIVNTVVTITILEIYRRVVRNTVFHKLKRRVGLAFTTLVYSLIYYVIFGDWRVSIISTAIMLTIVIQGLDGTRWWRYIVAIIPPILTLLFIDEVAFEFPSTYIFLLSLCFLLIVLLDLAVYIVIGRHRINGFKAPDLGSLFLRNWLNGDREIEGVFDGLGVYQNVASRVFRTNNFALIYTDLHYGPFSNTGSSQLPMIIRNIYSKLGLDVYLLHGFGSHDRNIASSKYVKDYLTRLETTIFDDCREQLKYHGSFKVSSRSYWEITGIVFDKLSLLIVSRPVKGIDDLPYELQVEYALKAKDLGIGDLILIDAHNWEKQDEMDFEELRRTLEESLVLIEKLRSRIPEKPLVKHHCFKTSAPGLIEGEACLLQIWSSNYEKTVLLLLRGNNMEPGLREDLAGLIRKSLGEEVIVEVLTNDEHSETGIRANITYIPVHNSESFKKDLEVQLERFKTIEPVEKLCVSKMNLNVKLLGDSAFQLEQLVRKSYVESALLLIAYAFLTPILLKFIWDLIWDAQGFRPF